MIAAFLCGVLYGWLGYRALVTAHNRRVLRETLPPSEAECWDYGPYNGDATYFGSGGQYRDHSERADWTRVTVDGLSFGEWLHRMRSEGSSVG